jgi:uncharacterized protein YdhG (YjbR/CyaY superfamily)
VQSAAKTVDEYLDELPEERRDAIANLRKLIKQNLPKGYRETVSFGMITYDVPLETFADTYNGQPLCYIGLAAQKNHLALYLTGVYGADSHETYLREAFRKEGKKLYMGKSCVRFKKLDDLALDAIATVIAGTTPDELIAKHEAVHGGKKRKK